MPPQAPPLEETPLTPPRRRWKRWFVVVVLLVVALLAAWFEPTRCVRGVLRGEPFHGGRPASWWAQEWEPWRIMPLRGLAEGNPDYDRWPLDRVEHCLFFRPPTLTPRQWFEEKFNAVFRPNAAAGLVWVEMLGEQGTPPLLWGTDPAALPVLEALQRHESAKVRLLARSSAKHLRDAQAP